MVAVAIIMIDASNFAIDLKKDLTLDHLSLIQGAEINHLIICVNKMDLIKWDNSIYKLIQKKVKKYFHDKNLL